MRAFFPWLFVGALSTASYADDAVVRAQNHADAALRHFNIQSYGAATAEYQQAYLLDPQPQYLYAIAQTQRLGGDCVKAIRSYEAYLRTKPADETKARTNIERCQQQLAANPPPATASREPTTAREPTMPPPPVASSATPPSATPVTPAPDTRLVRSDEPAAASWTSDWLGHALVVGGVGVAAAGAAFYLGGRSTIADHNGAATWDEFATTRDDADAARTRQRIGVSAMVVGGGLIIGGIARYVLAGGQPHRDSARISATVSQQEAYLIFARRF